MEGLSGRSLRSISGAIRVGGVRVVTGCPAHWTALRSQCQSPSPKVPNKRQQATAAGTSTPHIRILLGGNRGVRMLLLISLLASLCVQHTRCAILCTMRVPSDSIRQWSRIHEWRHTWSAAYVASLLLRARGNSAIPSIIHQSFHVTAVILLCAVGVIYYKIYLSALRAQRLRLTRKHIALQIAGSKPTRSSW